MASTSLKSVGRVIAPMLATLLLLGSVVVPLMDRERPGPSPRFESEHDSEACGGGHDHSICQQVGSNLSLRTESARTAGGLVRHQRAEPLGGVESPPHDPHYLPLGSRAPPVA